MTWQDILKIANKWDRFAPRVIEIAQKENKQKELTIFLRHISSNSFKTAEKSVKNKFWQKIIELFGPSQTLNYISIFRVAILKDQLAFLPENYQKLGLRNVVRIINHDGLYRHLSSKNDAQAVDKLILNKNLNNMYIVYRNRNKTTSPWETRSARPESVYYLSNGFIFQVPIIGDYKLFFNKYIKGSPYIINYYKEKPGKKIKRITKVIRGGYI